MENRYSNKQMVMITLLRIVIGWHFLYEGLFKYVSGNWSSGAFLLNSTGPLSPLFKIWGQSVMTLRIVDTLNVWGLILIGSCLFLGLLEKPAKFFAVFLLLLYYLAYPPLTSLGAGFHVDGNYWIVDRNFVEITSLSVLIVFPSSPITGLDRFIINSKIKKSNFLYKLFFPKSI